MTAPVNLEAAAPRILVVGDVMIDRYIFGHTSRISPEAPVPVVAAGHEDTRPGGAANVAANIGALGVACDLLTITGSDPAQKELERLVAPYGVNCIFITDAGQVTTQKTRIVSGAQQIARIDYDGSVSRNARQALRDCLSRIISGYAAVVFSDYNKGVLNDLPDMLAEARAAKVPSFVDPKVANPDHYRGAFLLKPNALEFEALFGATPEDRLVDSARLALQRLELQHILVTRGPKGILLVSANGEVADHPTEALEVFDVSGAGDTVMAALVAGYASGLSMHAAIDQANVAASVAVARTGTHVVTRAELDEQIQVRRSTMPKALLLPALLKRLERLRAKGAKIVFTNGCFDILHAGHVRMLAEAKRQGDVLIVGLNSDASVSRLKGPSRPVNGAADRAEVLNGLASVDFVVEFSDDTPLSLIEAIRPDVLIKGGDYDTDTIVGADIVRTGGGRVATVPFVEGRSTTSIIMRARIS